MYAASCSTKGSSVSGSSGFCLDLTLEAHALVGRLTRSFRVSSGCVYFMVCKLLSMVSGVLTEWMISSFWLMSKSCTPFCLSIEPCNQLLLVLSVLVPLAFPVVCCESFGILDMLLMLFDFFWLLPATKCKACEDDFSSFLIASRLFFNSCTFYFCPLAQKASCSSGLSSWRVLLFLRIETT